MRTRSIAILFLSLFLVGAIQLNAQEAKQETPQDTGQEATGEASAGELAKKLANPVASLISVPFQNNSDFGIGEYDGARNTMNIQPVLPIGLSDNLNLIIRWVQPVISQYNVTGMGEHQFGLGDATASVFFSPVEAKKGIIWGLGPVFLVPDGTNEYLTTKKFGTGLTAVVLTQKNGFTVGALVNQIWSVAGSDSRPDVNQFYAQPFFTYNWKSGAGLGFNFEITHSWESSSTTVWFNPYVNGVIAMGKQKVQLQFSPRFNLAAPEENKADWGIRCQLSFLFPRS